MTYYFYTLSDPTTKEVRYVGVTTYSLKTRYAQHKHTALREKDQTHKTKWFRSLLECSKLPLINLIKTYQCEDNSWEDIEKLLIASYPNLTNHHVGGKGIIKGERLQTTSSNRIPVAKIHPWRDTILEVYDSAKTAEKLLYGKPTGMISATVKGRHKHATGFRWSFIDPLVFPEKIPYYFLYVNNQLYGDYPSKAQMKPILKDLLNQNSVNIQITTMPPISS